MDEHSFSGFLASSDALRVYENEQLIFSSKRDRLLPLLEYIDRFSPYHERVVIFDKIMGNAAALLSIKAGCQEVYSPLFSQIAIKTLDKYGIKYHLTEIVPYIQKLGGEDICPMEELSINTEPEEFYKLMRNIINRRRTEGSGKN